MGLFGSEIEWMKNFGKKMERKTFWSVFGWMGKKENKSWDPSIFFPNPQKSSLQNEEKT